MEPTRTATSAVDTAAALVTACLEDEPDRHVINALVSEAYEGGWLFDLTAALALGFASSVEGIGQLLGQDPKELWRTWCVREAESRTLHGLQKRRPFDRGDGS